MNCIKKANKVFVLSILLFILFMGTSYISSAMTVEDFTDPLIPNGVYLCDEAYGDSSSFVYAWEWNRIRHVTTSYYGLWNDIDFNDRIDYIVIKGPYKVRVYDAPNFGNLTGWGSPMYSSKGGTTSWALNAYQWNGDPYPNADSDIRFVHNYWQGSRQFDGFGYMIGSLDCNPVAYQLLKANGASSIFIDSFYLATDQITFKSIKGGKIAYNTISSDEILDNSIQAVDIKDDTITGSKIKDLTIQAADIQNATITSGKIITGAFGYDKLDSSIQNKLDDTTSFSYKVIAGQKFEIQLPSLYSASLNSAPPFDQYNVPVAIKAVYWGGAPYPSPTNGYIGYTLSSYYTNTSNTQTNYAYLERDPSAWYADNSLPCSYKLKGIISTAKKITIPFVKNGSTYDPINNSLNPVTGMKVLSITLNVVDAPSATTPVINFNQ